MPTGHFLSGPSSDPSARGGATVLKVGGQIEQKIFFDPHFSVIGGGQNIAEIEVSLIRTFAFLAYS